MFVVRLKLQEPAAAADYRAVSTPRIVLNRRRLATLVVAAIAFPVAAGPADAASKHRQTKSKRAKVTKLAPKRVAVAKPAAVPAPAAAVPAAAPAPVATPTVTSVISIGGYVFYNLTYAEAVEAYFAAVAAAPAGYTPPPVTSISVDVSVGN